MMMKWMMSVSMKGTRGTRRSVPRNLRWKSVDWKMPQNAQLIAQCPTPLRTRSAQVRSSVTIPATLEKRQGARPQAEAGQAALLRVRQHAVARLTTNKCRLKTPAGPR